MMRCIQLLAVVKSSVLQTYGADQILEPVMKDVKQLEQASYCAFQPYVHKHLISVIHSIMLMYTLQDAGVSFHLDGAEYTFNGTFTLIPGDNLASQYLGGYKALASALQKCRQCLAVDEDMQSEVCTCMMLFSVHSLKLNLCFILFQFVSDAFQPRTRATHTAQCSSLGGLLHDHYSTTYGIHRDSILNTSRYFHVTERLVPDVMHDVLEGALQLEVKELITHLVSNKPCAFQNLLK